MGPGWQGCVYYLQASAKSVDSASWSPGGLSSFMTDSFARWKLGVLH